MTTPAEKPWFFVVRRFNGKEHFALEYGDQTSTRREMRELKNSPGAITRYELPDGYEPTFAEARAAYLRGIRPKPINRPKPPKTFNSIR